MNDVENAVPDIFIVVTFSDKTLSVCIFELLNKALAAPSVKIFAEVTFVLPKFEIDETLRVVK